MATPSSQIANPNESWRNYRKRVALHSCKVSTDDLKRLFRIINEKQKRLGEDAVAGLRQMANEAPDAFQQRQLKVQNAFITTARITGFNNETVTGHGEGVFDSDLLPERIMSIEYDTTFSPKAQLNTIPNNNVILFLDFSRPKVFGRGLPAEPTPNNSNWVISAESEVWSTSLNARLQEFFGERETRVNWLHLSTTYDALLLLIGFPLTLWAASRVGHPMSEKLHLPTSIQTALYVYLFFLFLNAFRWMFSYGRWIFPKIELADGKSAPGRHRAVWSLLVLGILTAAIWDAIKSFAWN